ncbi:hypothetical protein EI94DRAFT_1284225 [Lactarius quietus]|nr:hypothetical protein EI94DRAFT_1284225 [Lactarius quietus]
MHILQMTCFVRLTSYHYFSSSASINSAELDAHFHCLRCIFIFIFPLGINGLRTLAPVADYTLRVVRSLRLPVDLTLHHQSLLVIHQYSPKHADDGGKGLRLLTGLGCGYANEAERSSPSVCVLSSGSTGHRCTSGALSHLRDLTRLDMTKN